MSRKDRGTERTNGAAGHVSAEQMAAAGVAHHQAGRLEQAEDCYRRTLALDPKHLRTLYHLGIVGLQTNRPDLAADMINQAIAQDSSDPEWHYHLALAEQMRGRLDNAATHYSQAVRLDPDYAAAHTNLGNVLTQQGKFDEAAPHYVEVLRLNPDSPETPYNLANVLAQQGKHAEAIGHFQQALALQPNFAEAYHNLGLALMTLGRAAEARACYERAVTIKPDFAAAYRSLARALLAEQDADHALAATMLALPLDEQAETRALCVEALQSLQATPEIPGVRELVVRALDERWCRPALLTGAVYGLVAQNDAVRRCLERAGQTDVELLDTDALAALGADALFQRLLQSTPLTGVAMERLLTAARSRALAYADTGDAGGGTLAFYAALAGQCYINGYVYGLNPEESERADTLRSTLAAPLSSGAPVPAARLAAAAAYGPLHELRGAEAWLKQQGWPEPIQRLLDQQVRRPLEERRLAASIPALTVIGDGISRAVQTQYEENPYPVWTAAPPPAKAVAFEVTLRAKFPLASIRPHPGGGRTDMLIAGCGTGQQAVELAQQYANTSVLAVDLSLASLAYAKRQTIELGLDNIEYAQADILHLGGLGRAFDVIAATGVLHHIAEPEAGLEVLRSLLKPSGFMLLGLYSERAREHVVAAQRFAAERGFAADASGIRNFRQEVMALDESLPQAAIVKAADFYSISECRDLVFHVEEHRFALPQLKAMLAKHELEFLGFEIAPVLRRQYAAAFLDDKAMTDLDHWHAFEMQHPRSFVGMYQFWVQKRS